MIAITPNMRFVKPLSKYMDKRIRMYGRQRFADTFVRTGSNQKVITLPWLPDSAELLEIYHDSVRLLEGYKVSGKVVTFDVALNGRLDFISDTRVADTNEKWLKIEVNNLLQSTDLENTSYGTDRRAGQQVATHCKPICITQGALGFTRPSPDGDMLLFCPYYGMYGRDSITYAIKTDMGQLSDYRCVDIRIRDPNYIPPFRLSAVSAVSKPIKSHDVVYDIVPNAEGTYQLYGAVGAVGVIKLPNKKSIDEVMDYDFVLQGMDEAGDWFGLDEYFDEGEYRLAWTEDNPDYVVTKTGDSAQFGFTNAYRISFTAKKNSVKVFSIILWLKGREIWRTTIYTSNLDPTVDYAPTSDSKVTYTLDAQPPAVVPPVDPEAQEDVAVLTAGENIHTGGVNTLINLSNRNAEVRRLDISFKGSVSMDRAYYDPNEKADYNPTVDVSKDSYAIFDSTPPGKVDAPQVQSTLVAEEKFLWASSDPFSNMYTQRRQIFTYVNVCSVTTSATLPKP